MAERFQFDTSSVQILDLTLPFDFVHLWLESTTKQFWTASTKHLAFSEELNSEQSSELAAASLIETDVSVVNELTGGQQTYLHATISGVQFCITDGRLHLTVLNAIAESGNIQQINSEHTHLGHNDTVHIKSEFCPDAEPPSRISNDCAADNCSILMPTESGNKADENSALTNDGYEYDAAIRKPSVQDGVDNVEQLPAASTQDACRDIVVKKPDPTTTSASHPDTTGGAVKRKRGRPRKSVQISPADVLGNTVQTEKAVSTAVFPEVESTSTGRYSLRGKKLPPSIFGDSDPEQDEAEDDDEYRPPARKCSRLNTSHPDLENNGEGRLKANENYACSDSEPDRHRYKEEVTAGCENGQPSASQRQQKSQEMTEALDSTEGTLKLTPEGLVAGETFALSRKKKPQHRRLPSANQKHSLENGGGGKTSSKGTRMKVDVTGLPSFSRRKRNNERKAKCGYCGRRFCDFTGVAMHVRKFHSDAGDLQAYLETLKRLSIVTCALCVKDFDNRIQLQLHEDKVHFKTGALPCGQCGKTFSNMVLVKQHIRSVHQVTGQDHVCTICDARFKWSATLKVHVAEVHDGIRDLECDVCGKKFNRRGQLNRHALIHGADTAKLPCGLCGRKFSFANNLQRHMSIVHGPQEETWHCPYCEKGFQRKESLHNHVEKLHFSLFPYNCPVCRAGFLRAALLEKHMGAQHGLGQYQAPPGRRAHFKYNRQDQDELACALCQAQFFYKTQLVQHVFTAHADTFPYHCHVCQQVFMERSFLVLHRKKAHGLHPGPEDAHFDLDIASAGHHENVVVDTTGTSSDGRLHGKKASLAHNRKKVDAGVSDSAVELEGEPLATSTFVIKVENGSDTIQYVIQNPEGDGSVPSDAVVQDIANFLLAANNQTVHGAETSQGVEGFTPGLTAVHLQDMETNQGVEGYPPGVTSLHLQGVETNQEVADYPPGVAAIQSVHLQDANEEIEGFPPGVTALHLQDAETNEGVEGFSSEVAAVQSVPGVESGEEAANASCSQFPPSGAPDQHFQDAESHHEVVIFPAGIAANQFINDTESNEELQEGESFPTGIVANQSIKIQDTASEGFLSGVDDSSHAHIVIIPQDGYHGHHEEYILGEDVYEAESYAPLHVSGQQLVIRYEGSGPGKEGMSNIVNLQSEGGLRNQSLLASGSARPQRITVTGSDIIQDFSVDLDDRLSEQATPLSLGDDRLSEQATPLSLDDDRLSEQATPLSLDDDRLSIKATPVSLGDDRLSVNATPLSLGNDRLSEQATPLSLANDRLSEQATPLFLGDDRLSEQATPLSCQDSTPYISSSGEETLESAGVALETSHGYNADDT